MNPLRDASPAPHIEAPDIDTDSLSIGQALRLYGKLYDRLVDCLMFGSPTPDLYGCPECGLKDEDESSIVSHLKSDHGYPDEDANLAPTRFYE